MRQGQPSASLKPVICRVVAIGALLLAGCATTVPREGGDRAGILNNDKPDVVVTSTMLTDLTQRVARDEVDVIGILQAGDDPHIYEPVPADIQAFEQAELIFYNGYNLEPNLIKLINSAGANSRRFAVAEVVPPLEMNDGEASNVPDPHVWGDVQNAILMVKAIRDELIQLVPERRDRFTENAAQLIQELEALDQDIRQQIQTIPPERRQLVTTHDAFQYYANAYGLAIVGTLIGISTEEQPSAQTVKQLAQNIQRLGVPAIFAETTINPKLITAVAEEAGVQLAPRELYSDSLGTPGSDADSYVKMMTTNTQIITEALAGKPLTNQQ